MLKIQSLLFSNFYLKILSVIIAILLWFFVIGKSKNEMGIDASLEFKGIPEDVTIVNNIPTAIHVRLKGSSTLLRPLAEKRLLFNIDLSNIKIGENVILLEKKDLKNLPLGVEVIDISPVAITVILDKLIEKRLPVVVKTTGSPPHGYQLSETRIEPENVLARGTKSYLQEIDTIFTNPVNLNTVKNNTTREATLSFDPKRLKFIEPLTVKVFISISEERTQRSIKGIRINFTNKPATIKRISYSNYFVDLLVNSPQEMLLDEIRHDTKVVVDLAALNTIPQENTATLPIEVNLPNGVKLIWADPPQVEVVFNRIVKIGK
jgi:YbbR domain-containing protein